MIPLDDAIAHVLAGCRRLPPVGMPPAGAAGCVLAAEVVPPEPIPAFPNTAMDGYAVRAADVVAVPVTLPVVAEVAAGHPAPRPLEAGEAMRIFTGAPLPDGADAVVMVERTERRDGGKAVEIQVTVDPGNHVRTVGEDLHAGQRVFGAGDELTPARVGVVASLGVDALDVHPRPRVGVMSTGDELVTGPSPLQPGQIRDSNRPALLAAVAQAGCEPIDLGKVVLDRIGDMRWMRVAIRPAKPLAFGVVRSHGDGSRRREVPVFGLPGNPVSSLVSFELFARPGLRRLAGHPHPYLHRPRLLAT